MKSQIVARIHRDKQGNWLVSFPSVPGAHTYGRSLGQLRRRIPEVLQLWDVDPKRTDVIEVIQLPAALRAAIERSAKRREKLALEGRHLQAELQATIGRLHSQLRLGVRDSGELLGISPQYVHKLRRLSAERRAGKRRTLP